MLKSPSGFQSECCHQHMCSRHVEGGGSINGVHLSLALLFLIHPSLQPTLYHIIELRSHVVSLLSSYVCVSAFLHLFSDTSPCLLYVAIESFILLFEFGTVGLEGRRDFLSRAVSIGVRSLSSTSTKPFKTLFNSGEQL